MKAVILTKYGPPDTLQLKEVEKPVPQDDEVLIKIYATTVTAGDCELRSLKIPLLFRLPLRIYLGIKHPGGIILGQELAGEVEAVGKAVTKFKPGDQVFAATLMRLGTYAEYACLPQTYPIALKPAVMSYEEAATIPTGGINGLSFLKKATLQPGEKLLINGAGGSIGTYALQIAKSWGAEVTCVDSGEKLSMLTTLGANDVIDYTEEDFTQNGKTYDVIIDVVGKCPFSRTVRSLTPNGRYILGNPTLFSTIRGRWTSMTSSKQVLPDLASYKPEEIRILIELIEAGKIKVIIDKQYPLAQTAAAHRYVDTGGKKGNVVLTVPHNHPI